MAGAILVSLLWILTLCIIALFVHIHRIHNYWKKRGIPYDKPFFIFGNLGFLMRKSFSDYCDEIKVKFPCDYVGVFFGLRPALMVQTPELAKKVLTKDYECFQNRYIYSGFSDPLGTLNLFTVKNPIWKSMRHELSPLFTASRLKIVTELMNINATQLVDKVQRDYIDKKEDVNLKELFCMYTSDTIAYTVFGIRVSVLNNQPSPLWFITKHMVKWTFWRGFEFTTMFLLPSLAGFLRLKFFSEGATNYVKKMFNKVANERKQMANTQKDIVSHLLKLKENLNLPVEGDATFTENLILAQAAVFILGSVETSSTTLSYCLHELAYHPEEQQKLYEEVSSASLKSGKKVLEYEELRSAKYLTACVTETLRKHSPTPHIDRMCTQNYKISDNLIIEKDTPVFINLRAIHYDPKVYPEPEQWRPERWLSLPESDNNNYSFLSFGEGPKFCIGKRYGMLQVKAAIAQIVLNYKLEPAVPYSVETDTYSIILSPKDGGKVKFIPRD